MSKNNITENISFSRVNDEQSMKRNMIFVINIFNLSKFNIYEYLDRNKIILYNDLYKECQKNSNCGNINCNSLNELVMVKELLRDDSLFDKIHMGILKEENIIVYNGHITNMAYLKLSDKKLFKNYMREFKHRKHNWSYKAIVINNSKLANTNFEKKLLKELIVILKQSQIEYVTINKFKNITMLKKDVRDNILSFTSKKDSL